MPHLHVIGPPTFADAPAPAVTTDSAPSEPAAAHEAAPVADRPTREPRRHVHHRAEDA